MEKTRQYSALTAVSASALVPVAVSAVSAVAALAVLLAPAAASGPYAVPSGQPVELHEVLTDDAPGDLWLRFRFIAPEMGAADAEDSAADMAFLCKEVALPYIAAYGLDPARIVISFSEIETPFGEPAPGIAQLFESFLPRSTDCIWEGL